MNTDEFIKQGFELMAKKSGPPAIYTATVLSVNDDDTVQVVLDNGVSIDDVRLKAVVKSGNKLIVYPEEGSEVLIGSIENSNEYVVLAVDEVESVHLVIGDLEITIDDSLRIRKDSDSLKDVITLIIEAVEEIMVIYGNNPNYTKLIDARAQLNNIMD